VSREAREKSDCVRRAARSRRSTGPFAEAKEVIGGYAILRAGSWEQAIALTRGFLEVAGDGTCELHQLYEMPATR
jgi:hypothetical protein